MSSRLAFLFPLIAFAAGLLPGCATSPAPPVVAPPPPPSVPVAVAVPDGWTMLPAPRQMNIERAIAPSDILIVPQTSPALSPPLATALQSLAVSFGAESKSAVPVAASVDPQRVPHPQGYTLSISAPGPADWPTITLIAHDEPGLFHAVQTLRQITALAAEKSAFPLCEISDYPDFPNRGIMLDIARDKVPQMSTLFALVDRMASWKCNQLQLYTEHTFAYAGHEVVWRDASPMTAEEIRVLDQYCRERFIELVPNQNSFGHMGRWLAHPEYAGLAETEGGSDLCPVDPGSIELLRSMYSSLLPNFSSTQFNVGCDETWSLGKGRSKAAVARRGVGRVYLEFLLKIRALVAENGKTMQFWADIINNHPELIPELPKDLVAMEWGYEANHPFAEHAQRFHDNRVRFYVVPGTSSWNSLLGRTDNALANLRNAAANGSRLGGEGFLVTDWGDGGHWQSLPVSYLPYAYGAALSWCFESNQAADPSELASRYAFEDHANVMGRIAFDLGNAQARTGMEFGNNTTYYMLLNRSVEKPLAEAGLGQLRAEDLEATVAFLDETLARLDQAQMQRPDAERIQAEFRMNAALAKLACRLGAARVRAGGVRTSELPRETRLTLAAELGPIMDEFQRLWLETNRPGGLKDSVGRLQNLQRILQG